MRRGLLRLYVVVAVPWVGWFGYVAYHSYTEHIWYKEFTSPDFRDYVREERDKYGSFVGTTRYRQLLIDEAFVRVGETEGNKSLARAKTAIYALPIVPIGGPLLYLVIVWVIAGFRKSARKTGEARPKADYYPVIARAVSGLASYTRETRQALYDRARAALDAQLHAQGLSEEQIAQERRTLEAAIRKVEREAAPRQKRPKMRGPASTTLLIVSMFFPSLWAIDFTSMSLYWVARLPKVH